MSKKVLTKCDVSAFKAAVIFARNDDERVKAVDNLITGVAMNTQAAIAERPNHRPAERDQYKFEAMCFIEEMVDNWEKLRWDYRTSIISRLAVDSCVGTYKSTDAKKRLIKGLRICLEDRIVGDIALDAIELLSLKAKPQKSV